MRRSWLPIRIRCLQRQAIIIPHFRRKQGGPTCGGRRRHSDHGLLLPTPILSDLKTKSPCNRALPAETAPAIRSAAVHHLRRPFLRRLFLQRHIDRLPGLLPECGQIVRWRRRQFHQSFVDLFLMLGQLGERRPCCPGRSRLDHLAVQKHVSASTQNQALRMMGRKHGPSGISVATSCNK